MGSNRRSTKTATKAIGRETNSWQLLVDGYQATLDGEATAKGKYQTFLTKYPVLVTPMESLPEYIHRTVKPSCMLWPSKANGEYVPVGSMSLAKEAETFRASKEWKVVNAFRSWLLRNCKDSFRVERVRKPVQGVLATVEGGKLAIDPSSSKLPELKAECQRIGIPEKGKKEELRERLKNWQKEEQKKAVTPPKRLAEADRLLAQFKAKIEGGRLEAKLVAQITAKITEIQGVLKAMK